MQIFVAPDGTAPPLCGCKPHALLLHQGAIELHEGLEPSSLAYKASASPSMLMEPIEEMEGIKPSLQGS